MWCPTTLGTGGRNGTKLVSRLFRLQNEAKPDDDPGDLTIDVQDDSAMTAVFQKGRVIAYGGSIQEALENAVKAQMTWMGRAEVSPDRQGRSDVSD